MRKLLTAVCATHFQGIKYFPVIFLANVHDLHPCLLEEIVP